VEFIAAHRGRFGVEPMCRVLGGHGVRIAPSMYYAAEARPPSARAVADAALLGEIVRVHADPNLAPRPLRGPQDLAPAAP
jgi:putative transposase